MLEREFTRADRMRAPPRAVQKTMSAWDQIIDVFKTIPVEIAILVGASYVLILISTPAVTQ